ncbi:MAG: Crp/Fnr family transcriptional regulator [Candidatus Binatia bacterium]
MKNFNWNDLLRYHPLFSSLNEKEIEQLLKDEVSQERDRPQGSVILKEGEVGDSFFLIGSGSVKVVLPGEDGHGTTLSILKKGEFFGEMALFEQRPRSATVIANETCTLLEVKGEEFLKLLREHTQIALELLLKLSERLRHTSEQLLAVKLKGVDEKLDLFNTKFDTKLEVFDKSLDAAHTVFKQTETRTNEVIESAERWRLRLVAFATVGGAVITGLTLFGVKNTLDITKTAGNIRKIETEITQAKQDAMQTLADVKIKVADVKRKAKEVEGLTKILPRIRRDAAEIASITILGMVRDPQKREDSDAPTLVKQVLELSDPALTRRLLDQIEMKVIEEKDRFKEKDRKDRRFFGEVLATSVDYIDRPKDKIQAYYLYLAVLILENKYEEKEFKNTFSSFKEYVVKHENQRIGEKVFIFLDDLFKKQKDPKKRDWWLRVKAKIP